MLSVVLIPFLQYNEGIPSGSRLDIEKDRQFDALRTWLQSPEGQSDVAKVRELSAYAEKGMYHWVRCRFCSRCILELGCTVTHLALAWIAVKQHTSTVILGASRPDQIIDNLKALDVIPKLTPSVLEKIEEIIKTKPAPVVRFVFKSRIALVPTDYLFSPCTVATLCTATCQHPSEEWSENA